MNVYWLAPILCGALGYGLSFPVKHYISKLSQTKMLESVLLSDKVIQTISDSIGYKIVELTQDTRTIGEVTDLYIGEETRKSAINSGSAKLAEVITIELKNSQIANIILEEIKRVLVEKIKLGLVAGLMKGSLWEMVEEPMEKALESYLDERCQPLLEEKLKERFQMLSEKRMYELGELFFNHRDRITEVILDIYKKNILDLADHIVSQTGSINKLFPKQLSRMQIGMAGFGGICGLLSMALLLI